MVSDLHTEKPPSDKPQDTSQTLLNIMHSPGGEHNLNPSVFFL